jgi:hypothetical protein
MKESFFDGKFFFSFFKKRKVSFGNHFTRAHVEPFSLVMIEFCIPFSRLLSSVVIH